MFTNLLDILSIEYENKESGHVPQNLDGDTSLKHHSDSLKFVFH